MEILRINRKDIVRYTSRQIVNLLPDDVSIEEELALHLDEALNRLEICINAVKSWRSDCFDPFHSSQYCTFLYFWANTIWRQNGNRDVPTRLFLLNKAMNGIDLFYEIEMPPIFFIGHSVGIVLAKATYGNYLVLYQNSTIGKNHGEAPVIEDGVILYPNTAVIGRSRVYAGSIISQGVSVVNRNTEPDAVVYQGEAGSLIFKKIERNILGDFFNVKPSSV